MKSVELFAGAGGLALGGAQAGFEHAVAVEWDKWACDTIRENQSAGFELVQGWKVHEGDVRDVNWDEYEDVELVAGGPPCQPFSSAGRAKSHDDKRDMFPATAEVIRELRPKAFLIENVRGLTRSAFANYFQYIILRLKYPEQVAADLETWTDHLSRLQIVDTSPSIKTLKYNVVTALANAADFGVPQQRHRVFFVGFRDDLDAEYSFPKATHSYDSLLYDQWVTGEYWDRHGISKKDRPEIGRLAARVARLREAGKDDLEPWVTVRDALHDIPEPELYPSKAWKNHLLQEGARSYKGHTGSPLDLPAKTLKAGTHGVPGGENMLRRLDGSIRYFTIREAARLQTFPDTYELHGSWTEAMRQIGNAVPVELARIVSESVREHIITADSRPRYEERPVHLL